MARKNSTNKAAPPVSGWGIRVAYSDSPGTFFAHGKDGLFFALTRQSADAFARDLRENGIRPVKVVKVTMAEPVSPAPRRTAK